jgi:hypothetical protein
MERRHYERYPADFQVRVTAVDSPDLTASGQAVDLSQSGISVYLPLQLTTGTAVRLNIEDTVLFGFVAHAEPERSFFRTGIEVLQVLVGESGPSQQLKAKLEEVMPAVQLLETLP